jgi:hypothetical protein
MQLACHDLAKMIYIFEFTLNKYMSGPTFKDLQALPSNEVGLNYPNYQLPKK